MTARSLSLSRRICAAHEPLALLMVVDLVGQCGRGVDDRLAARLVVRVRAAAGVLVEAGEVAALVGDEGGADVAWLQARRPGDVVEVRLAPVVLLEGGRRPIDGVHPAADRSGDPVLGAQLVQDRPADPGHCIGLERQATVHVEPADGIDESDGAEAHEIRPLEAGRQAHVQPRDDVAHQGGVGDDQPIVGRVVGQAGTRHPGGRELAIVVEDRGEAIDERLDVGRIEAGSRLVDHCRHVRTLPGCARIPWPREGPRDGWMCAHHGYGTEARRSAPIAPMTSRSSPVRRTSRLARSWAVPAGRVTYGVNGVRIRAPHALVRGCRRGGVR